ncbi:MAG: ribbon-helix-helix domain-containing protein [Defluviitaleaceae bacterium]|nr:ribbon-helix-helix domain-containing protein [Defluviitaleaceae bacterium]MCL2262268.1 ribbon-helix-helix domain-containing protein [Defluviitaleaceae bacterium]
MNDKFIPKIPERTVISIRLEDVLISQIDGFAKRQKMSRNELIKQCILFAIQHIDEDVFQG